MPESLVEALTTIAPITTVVMSSRTFTRLLGGTTGGLLVLAMTCGFGSTALAVETAPISVPRPSSPETGAAPGEPSGTGGPEAEAPGQTAAITSTRQIILELGRRTISLVEDGQVKGSWPVAIGDPSTPTPTGTFTIENMVVNPQYQSTKSGKVNPTTGPNGPLGDRWIGFLREGPNQYGIHGTPPAWSWTVTGRTAVTNGCVRMLTPHVRQLFSQVDVGTPVLVRR
jgi:lipoprotein-anchoring transpeptidase ErfK/SrfK